MKVSQSLESFLPLNKLIHVFSFLFDFMRFVACAFVALFFVFLPFKINVEAKKECFIFLISSKTQKTPQKKLELRTNTLLQSMWFPADF